MGKYETLGTHDDVFAVPELTMDDAPIYAGMTHLGYGKWAYTLAVGPYEADVRYFGDELRHGSPADESQSLAVLLSFLGTYGEEGHITYDGDDDHLIHDGETKASGDTAWWLKDNAQRFSMAASDLEEGHLAFTVTEWSEEIGEPVRYARETEPPRDLTDNADNENYRPSGMG